MAFAISAATTFSIALISLSGSLLFALPTGYVDISSEFIIKII
jgi:ABC-type sulfate transport system permease component